MRKYRRPRIVVTAGLCSHRAAMKEIVNVDRHEVGSSPQQSGRKLASAFSTTRASRTAVPEFSSVHAQAHNQLRWLNRAQFWPDPHLEFRLVAPDGCRAQSVRFCLTTPKPDLGIVPVQLILSPPSPSVSDIGTFTPHYASSSSSDFASFRSRVSKPSVSQP